LRPENVPADSRPPGCLTTDRTPHRQQQRYDGTAASVDAAAALAVAPAVAAPRKRPIALVRPCAGGRNRPGLRPGIVPIAFGAAPAAGWRRLTTERVRGPVALTVAPTPGMRPRCDSGLVRTLGRSLAPTAIFPVAPERGLGRTVAPRGDLVRGPRQSAASARQLLSIDAASADRVPANDPANASAASGCEWGRRRPALARAPQPSQ